ncbi:hypothetical protein ABPG75_013279 [Micractinium tetrahymenae]
METLRPDWPLLLVTSLSLVATLAFTLAFPMAMGAVFDLVRAQGGLAGGAAAPTAAAVGPFSHGAMAAPTSFQGVLLRLGACMVLSATGNALVAYLSTLLGERFGHRLKGRLMQIIMAQEQSFFDSTTKGDLVSRLTLDVQVLQATVADFIGLRGFRSLFEVLGALCLMCTQQPLLALVSLAITPLLSRLLRAVVVRSSAIIFRRQQVAAKALDFASERLSQVQTVQVFAQQEREAAAFAQLSEGALVLSRKYAFFQGIVEGTGRLAVNVGTMSLLGLGGMLVIQNKISVGALLAVNMLNVFISVGLSSAAASLGELGKAVGALERVAELVAPSQAAASAGSSEAASSSSETASSSGCSGSNGAGPSVLDGSSTSSTSSSRSTPTVAAAAQPEASISGRVELRDVWFKYPGAADWAVRGLNLTLLPGQTVALVGPSGGGKSTIAALLLGLYRPQRGEILVDGAPLPAAGEGGRGAAAVGMAAVLQQPMLMSGSVTQQISYGKPEASHAEILAAARAAHAEEFVQQLPQGYDTEVGERGHALSGGQKQRLAIARALLLQPKVLVLDEVTSALDVTSERYINDTLRHLAATKLIIAHRLSMVRRADLIVVVEGGQVVEAGSREQLLAMPDGIYRRFVSTAELGWVEGGLSDSSSGSSSDEGAAAAGGKGAQQMPMAAD